MLGAEIVPQITGGNVQWRGQGRYCLEEKCLDQHAWLQVSTCSSYDLCHLVNTHTHRHTKTELWPDIPLAQPAEL